MYRILFIFFLKCHIKFQYRLKGDKHVEMTLAWVGDKKEVILLYFDVYLLWPDRSVGRELEAEVG